MMQKKNINLGAYGWKHTGWKGSFYPDDLPEDWQLTYYSNVFSSVLVPVEYWCGEVVPDCEEWLESVHDDFRFHIACDERLFEHLSLAELSDCLIELKQTLASLVFLPAENELSEQGIRQFMSLLEALAKDGSGAEVFGAGQSFAQLSASAGPVWRPGADVGGSRFAYIENDVSDMREARQLVDAFVQQLPEALSQEVVEATVIVNHPDLQAETVARLRSVIEIMGY